VLKPFHGLPAFSTERPEDGPPIRRPETRSRWLFVGLAVCYIRRSALGYEWTVCPTRWPLPGYHRLHGADTTEQARYHGGRRSRGPSRAFDDSQSLFGVEPRHDCWKGGSEVESNRVSLERVGFSENRGLWVVVSARMRDDAELAGEHLDFSILFPGRLVACSVR